MSTKSLVIYILQHLALDMASIILLLNVSKLNFNLCKSRTNRITNLINHFKVLNFTHRIDEFSFGTHYPSLVNPLDNSVEIAEARMFSYYILNSCNSLI
jgi:hypothetical protein